MRPGAERAIISPIENLRGFASPSTETVHGTVTKFFVIGGSPAVPNRKVVVVVFLERGLLFSCCPAIVSRSISPGILPQTGKMGAFEASTTPAVATSPREIAPSHVNAFRRYIGVGQIRAFLIRHERSLTAFYMLPI
jgi:hypothetical protein